jgi:two-component system, LytTR family, response regulator
MHALIVDDEPLARERVRELLRDDPDVESIRECRNGREAVAAMEERPADLVFLDVEMPELDGFGFLRALPAGSAPVVIFVTAYDRYAVRAFESQAFDYLLKPFDRDRFDETLARAKRRSGDSASVRELLARVRELQGERRAVRPAGRLAVRAGRRILFLKSEEIDWIEAEGNYVRLHTGKQSHLLRETIGRIHEKLDAARFRRIHRSTIVNIERVRELQPSFHGDYRVILDDGTQLTLSRSYRDLIDELAGDGVVVVRK